jgi:hypothetical protein
LSLGDRAGDAKRSQQREKTGDFFHGVVLFRRRYL